MSTLTGKVLWYSVNEKRGVVQANGKEYVFYSNENYDEDTIVDFKVPAKEKAEAVIINLNKLVH